MSDTETDTYRNMPTIEIQIDSPGTLVPAPHILPFTVLLHDVSHANYPVFFKSLAAHFATSTNLPTKMEIHTTNLHHDPLHTAIAFPFAQPSTASHTFHFHSDFHVGDVSNDHTVQGFIKFYGIGNVQLPSHLSMVWFVDSQYM